MLPPDRIVVEILETVSPTPEIIQACEELCEAGYSLALDDFTDDPKWAPLLPLIKFLKVDFRATDHEKRQAIAERFRSNGRQLLAEKVETQAEVKEGRKLGYSLFQGFFFCRPTMVSGKDIPVNKLIYLQLLEAIAAPELSYSKIEDLLKHEPSLVYKLLRYMNSPLVGLRIEIHGVREAIALLGEREFRRWVSIVAVSSMASDKAPELIRTALTRAYFCEEFAGPAGLCAEKFDLFLMGLLSVVDALLDRPMEQILATVPVSSDVRAALTGWPNRFRSVYETLLAYEQADWAKLADVASTFPTIESHVPNCYLAAATRVNAFSN